ncbi:MAG: hypothetical protein JJE04_07680 [Acidobacteriia bacterium]|nr:hypothetical protein [Terriglobia bacterium]
MIAIPLLTAAVVFPAIRLAALKIIGRAQQCSLRQAVDSFGVMKDRQTRSRDIRAMARLIRSEDGFDLMSTRDGHYWVPKRNHETLFGKAG